MVNNYEDIINYANKYNLPIIDVLSIALNRYGIKMDIPDNRIRFKLNFLDSNEKFYFAVCVNTYESPFSLKNNKLFLADKEIAKINKIEKDTCTSTYFRNDGKALVLNSNARSMCKGCKFCGTYALDSDDIDILDQSNKMEDYILSHITKSKIPTLEDVTVCTGCFNSEEDLVNHLLMLNKILMKYGFNGRINYIGSQLRNYNLLEKVAKNINKFSLLITTEKFSNRLEIMRNEKASLDLNETKDLAKKARDLGFTVTILYILGLEDLDILSLNMKELQPFINKMPTIQIFQNYTLEQENYRCKEARDFKYYLEARTIIEDIFSNNIYKPLKWENYRSLFYTSYKKEKY